MTMSIWKSATIYWFQIRSCNELHRKIHDVYKGIELVARWHCPEMQIAHKIEAPLAELHCLLASIDDVKRNRMLEMFVERRYFVMRRWLSRSRGYHCTADLYYHALENMKEVSSEIEPNQDHASFIIQCIDDYTVNVKDWCDLLMSLPRGIVSRYDINDELDSMIQTFRERVESSCAHEFTQRVNVKLHCGVS